MARFWTADTRESDRRFAIRFFSQRQMEQAAFARGPTRLDRPDRRRIQSGQQFRFATTQGSQGTTVSSRPGEQEMNKEVNK